MTNELEKQFFDKFGIEPREKVNQTFNGAEFKVETINEYPQITDRILLELICLFATDIDYFTCCPLDIEALKEDILKKFIFHNKLFDKQQVQALFKECK